MKLLFDQNLSPGLVTKPGRSCRPGALQGLKHTALVDIAIGADLAANRKTENGCPSPSESAMDYYEQLRIMEKS